MTILLNLLAGMNLLLWIINVYQVYAEVLGGLKYFNVISNLVVACLCWYVAWTLR